MQSLIQDKIFRDQYRGKRSTGLTAYFFDTFYANRTDAPVLREAKALKAHWEQVPIRVYQEELLVGFVDSGEIADFHYGDGVRLHWDRIEALGGAYPAKAREIGGLIYRNFWQEGADPNLYTEEELCAIKSGAASSTWFGGHMAMDYEQIMAMGLSGYQKKLEAMAPGDFREALLLTLSGFQALIQRTAEACRGLHMEKQAAALTHIAAHPPTSFFEALELTLMVHIGANADSFGRIDSYLRPYYEADIESGALTDEAALDLLQSLVIKIEEQEQIQNMTIGGILPNGSSGYTRLTELILAATRNIGYKGPNLCFRVHPSMPAHYWGLILDSLETGQGLPALYNDTAVIKTLEIGGFPQELARDYCLGGCSQIMLGGRCQFVNDIGLMNIAKIFELTLYSGETFERFEDLYCAFTDRLGYYARMEAAVNNKDILQRGEKEGYAFRALFTRGCIESGKGIFAGGPLYQNVQLECIGITNTADSLYAVKQAVFEEKRVSLNALREALKRDFAGDNALVTYLKSLPKFGNDINEVDDLRASITKNLFDALRRQKGPFGGRYIPGEVIFTAHEHCGAAVGATPDGRRKGAVLADSAGSSQGMNINGPTALMNSVKKIPLDDMITSVVLNMKFHKAFFKANRAAVTSLFKAYFAGGGEQLQINVCDTEELKDALVHPEQHGDLVVRVGGYSDYFVRLNRRLQEDVISRQEAVV